MKIMLITFHTPKNYGAILQAYSLYTYLHVYTNEVSLIDYNTPALRDKYIIYPRITGIKSWIKFILMLPTYKYKKKKFHKFDEFVAKRFVKTKRYESTFELYSDTPQADIYFTGSDQVFNPNRNIDERKAFYLDFVLPEYTRFSYAASFGVRDISGDKKKEICDYLKKFTAISVRESNGIKLIHDLSGLTSKQVLDPVFLNEREIWKNLAIPYNNNKYKHYLLYYKLMDSKESDQAAIKIANEKNLSIVTITDNFMKRNIGTVLRDVGPQEFLSLVMESDFVVTDSFHGVAFSLIFEKQFVFSDMNKQTNVRGYDLLNLCEITQNAYLNTYVSGNTIQYDKVTHILNRKIKESKQYIENCIKRTTNNE